MAPEGRRPRRRLAWPPAGDDPSCRLLRSAGGLLAGAALNAATPSSRSARARVEIAGVAGGAPRNLVVTGASTLKGNALVEGSLEVLQSVVARYL